MNGRHHIGERMRPARQRVIALNGTPERASGRHDAMRRDVREVNPRDTRARPDARKSAYRSRKINNAGADGASVDDEAPIRETRRNCAVRDAVRRGAFVQLECNWIIADNGRND